MKCAVRMVILVALLISILGGLPTRVWATMQGFEGENAITCPYEKIDIIVFFVTPSSVALSLAYERGEIMPPNFTEGMSFNEYALKGHTRFRQQLALILDDYEFEIIHEFHTLVNGVEMRVRGGMVESIANMPEVSVVFPSEEYEDGGEDEPVITDNINIVMLNDVSFWSVDGSATPSAEILNVNDLSTYVSEHNFEFHSFAIAKYDESFFNERFLYFLPITKPNSPNEFEIEVTVGEDIIQVDVIHTMMGDDDAEGQWLIILEIHRTLLGRNISVLMATAPPTEAHGTGWHFDPTEGTLTISTNEGTTAWRTESGNYFQPSDVRNIIINDGVTAIGDEAFSGMSSVSLTSVTIPAGVTSIGDRAFFNSRSLTSLTFQSGTPPSFGNDVFQFSDSLTHIVVPYVAVGSFQNVPQLSGFIISHFGIIPDSGVSNIATYVVALFAFIGISLLGIYMLVKLQTNSNA